jgi:2-dehydro-3-deoxyphosphogluconate aldolase/(4S)-4-hydroxy-2-oxoglutarate aldolase
MSFKNILGLLLDLEPIRTIDDIDLAINNNFTFGITPGFSPNLCSYAQSKNFLIIPGIQSASEIMQASEMGYSILKFFPAELSGGAKKLKALQSVFPDISFIPTGGVNKNNLKSYLELENVICAGSSDFVSKDMLATGEWEDIVLNIQNIKKDLI